MIINKNIEETERKQQIFLKYDVLILFFAYYLVQIIKSLFPLNLNQSAFFIDLN